MLGSEAAIMSLALTQDEAANSSKAVKPEQSVGVQSRYEFVGRRQQRTDQPWTHVNQHAQAAMSRNREGKAFRL